MGVPFCIFSQSQVSRREESCSSWLDWGPVVGFGHISLRLSPHCEPTFTSGDSGFRMWERALKALPTGTDMRDFLWERRDRREQTSDLKISEGCVRQIEYYWFPVSIFLWPSSLRQLVWQSLDRGWRLFKVGLCMILKVRLLTSNFPCYMKSIQGQHFHMASHFIEKQLQSLAVFRWLWRKEGKWLLSSFLFSTNMMCSVSV